MVLPITLAACNTPSSSENAGSVADPTSIGMETHTLDAYHWWLSNAENSQGVRIGALFVSKNSPVQLDFTEDRMAVKNTCNNMTGGYEISGDQLTFSHMASTMKACPDQKLMALDNEIGNRLSGILTFTVRTGNPPELILTTAHNDKLVFTGELTAATNYGTDGEIAFLEIAAETKSCQQSYVPGTQCLQVREVYYDANGLKNREPGEWQNFSQQIKGYTHQPGIRNVVRTKRYRIANTPSSDAPDVAYELDMIVESELVKP